MKTTSTIVQSRALSMVVVLGLFASVLLIASPARAAEIDYTLEATVLSSPFAEIPVNSFVAISYSIEDATPESPLTQSDPTSAQYDGAITDLSVEFASARPPIPPFYTVLGDFDASLTTVNNVRVVDRISGDSNIAQLASNSRVPDGSLVGTGVFLGGALPLRIQIDGFDTDGITLSDDSIDITQTEYSRFVDPSNLNTSSQVVIAFADASGTHAGFVVIGLSSVIVADGEENAEPTADPEGPYLDAQDTEINFDGSASTDPDGDSLAFDWEFGDGTSATGEFPTHTYSSAGVYEVCLIVNDGVADSTQVCTSAVIYDPSAGFVTGGGSIQSPTGAYMAAPTQSGKATFGFVSKYKKGTSIPTGNTQFYLQAGDLNFHSTSYEWLVVTGDHSAKFKGEGSVNGVDGYKFQLWANDANPDTFRIKIWMGEDVVYDNGSHQAISKGSIIVHTK